MSKYIGGIAHEAVGSLATHKPSKSLGDLFEEKKAQLEVFKQVLSVPCYLRCLLCQLRKTRQSLTAMSLH